MSVLAIALAVALYLPSSVDEGSLRPPLVIAERPSDYLPAVKIRAFEFGFEPERLVVKAGHPVSWRAVGEQQHLVAPSDDAAEWVFERAYRRGAARHIFEKPGVYGYFCVLHPKMRGTITVVRRL